MNTNSKSEEFNAAIEAQVLHVDALEIIGMAGDDEESGWQKTDACAKARPLLELAVSLNPKAAETRAHLGIALKTLEEEDEALYHLIRAINEGAGSTDARVMAINLLGSRDRYGEAESIAEEGTRKNPDTMIFWYLHAHCCIKTQRPEDALKSAQQALNLIKMEEEFSVPDLKNSIIKMIDRAREGIRKDDPSAHLLPEPS